MKFENSVIINQPVDKVFEFVTNLKNNTKWQTYILELEMTSEGPFELGANFRCANRFMGKRIETECVITDYVPDKAWSILITAGSVSGTSSFFFETVDGCTKVTTTGDLDLGYFKLTKMIAKRKIHQQLKKDMLKLKYVLENGRES